MHFILSWPFPRDRDEKVGALSLSCPTSAVTHLQIPPHFQLFHKSESLLISSQLSWPHSTCLNLVHSSGFSLLGTNQIEWGDTTLPTTSVLTQSVGLSLSKHWSQPNKTASALSPYWPEHLGIPSPAGARRRPPLTVTAGTRSKGGRQPVQRTVLRFRWWL